MTRWISTALAARSRFRGAVDEVVVAGNGTSIGTRAASERNSREARPGTRQYEAVPLEVLARPATEPALACAASLRGEERDSGGFSPRSCEEVRLAVAAAE